MASAISISDPRHYWLASHVYTCTLPGGAIFLDTRRDRYFGLSGPQLHALALTVRGWPPCGAASIPQQDAINVAELFVANNVLTRDPAFGRSAANITLAPATDVAPAMSVRIRLRDLAHFIHACTHAFLSLRWRSLEAIAQAAKMHKARNPSESELLERVAIFRSLRPYFFSGRDSCLFHSLALLNFLHAGDLSATWVIGVKTDPWAAHSWLQHGRYVLDSTPEIVRFYTPILVV